MIGIGYRFHRRALEGVAMIAALTGPAWLHFARGDREAAWKIGGAMVAVFVLWLLRIVGTDLAVDVWLAAWTIPPRSYFENAAGELEA